MLRGNLKRKSLFLNIFQKLIDPFILILIFIVLFNKNDFFSVSQILLSFLIITFVLNSNRIYESHRIKNIHTIIPKIFFICSSLTIYSLFFMASKNKVDNSTFLEFFVLCFGYLFLHHFLVRVFLRKIRTIGFNSRKAVFVGNKESYKKLLDELKKYPWIGYKIMLWFSPNYNDYKELNEINPESLNCKGCINDINEHNLNDIDKIFFSHNDNDEITFEKVIEILGDTSIPLSLFINWKINSLSLNREYFGDLLTLNIWNSDKSNFYLNIKASIDFIVALIAIILLSPIFLLISLSIKLEGKGPIIFNQKRYGKKGEIFNMYKFRTMHQEIEQNTKFPEQAKLGDKRVTNVGKFLRKFSIDEFPQLINVLKGDMSLIGPRPHAVEHNEYYRKLIIGYMQRHSRKPGITGLAQISGARGETTNIESMELRIKYDLEYINNWNLVNDLIILLKTFFHILKGEAY